MSFEPASLALPPLPSAQPPARFQEVPLQQAQLPGTQPLPAAQEHMPLPSEPAFWSSNDALPCDAVSVLGPCDTVPDGRLLPFANLAVKAGNRRVIGEARGFFPLWQDPGNLLYLDTRVRLDDHDAGDFNLGLGYRTLITPEWIFGSLIYYDLLASAQENVFHQATLGVELLSLKWDFRINGHFPQSGGASAAAATGISNGTIITNANIERAYAGFDAELGRRLLHWGWNDRFEIRWYAGGYYFNHTASGFDGFGGPKARMEFRIYDLPVFGEQSRLVLGAETSWDTMRNEQFAGFLRVRIPLGRRSGRDRIDPLRRRMLDLPVRDVD